MASARMEEYELQSRIAKKESRISSASWLFVLVVIFGLVFGAVSVPLLLVHPNVRVVELGNSLIITQTQGVDTSALENALQNWLKEHPNMQIREIKPLTASQGTTTSLSVVVEPATDGGK